MDQINSNPYFNSAHLYQNQQAQQKANPSVERSIPSAESSRTESSSAQESDYSNLFDDDALLKLQSNLEAIAQMAEQSLKQIDD